MQTINTIFATILMSGLAGCALITPSSPHTEIITIDPSISNPDLTTRLLGILATNNIVPCAGISPLTNITEPPCLLAWWQGTLTKTDPDNAIVEIGDFSANFNRSAGHSARLRRTSDDTLELVVKGVGVYYMEIPNADAARVVAQIIRDNL